MKFPLFKEIASFRESNITIADVVSYLATGMAYNLRELYTGLQRLSLDDNFQSFKAEVTIGAGLEVATRHNLGQVPGGKIILKADNNAVVDGDTENDSNFVYLKNPSGSSATVTVIWLK